MRTIALEQAGQQIAEALEQHRLEDSILLTRGSDAIGILVRLPEGTRPSDVDGVFWLEEPMGRVLIFVEARSSPRGGQEAASGSPVFGSCKAMLTIESADDEHLKDFEEYMQGV
jgi:hypothetical protein